MKSPLLIFLSFTNSFLSQSNWTFGIQQGNVVYQKLNPLMTQFLKENDKDQFSYNRLYYLNRNIKLSSKSTLGVGLSFEKRKMRVLIMNDSVIKRTGGPGPTGEYFTKKIGIKTDMVLINYSQGLNFSYKYMLHANEKRQIQVGGVLHNYFTNISFDKITKHRKNKEFSGKTTENDYSTGPEPPLFINRAPSYTATIEVFGNLLYKLKKSNTFGLRLSLGTSLKSNWDNFSKYLWLGTGIEYGFGKKKEKVKKVE